MKICNIVLLVVLCLVVSVGLIAVVYFPASNKSTSIKASTSFTVSETDTLVYDTHSGLVADTNLRLILANCSSCHATDLVRQNRFTRDGWLAKIRWMQEKHNLWDLGESEAAILDYLEKYYSPSSMDKRARLRREPLTDIEWYDY